MNKRTTVMLAVLLLAAFVLAACGGQKAQPTQAPVPTQAPAATQAPAPTQAPVATAVPEPDLVGDSLRGGRLYDDWMEELGVDAPVGDQPLWATQSSNKRSDGDTWRCKECHGWDYKGADGAYGSGSHKTGFVGVFQTAGTSPSEILTTLQGATNPDHDFSSVLDDQALTDLSLFLSQELVDDSKFVNADKSLVGGDATIGKSFFDDNCSDCHGPQGLAINFGADEGEVEYYGTIASDNPWEFLNKARFGQPGVDRMPSMVDIGASDQEYADLLIYATSLPTSSPVTEGGLLYDKWWKAMGVDAPTSDQPLWATQSSNTRSGADSWRCKECHGWDYKGVDGAYSSGSHKTGFKGVFDAASMSADELTAWLDGSKNTDHNFAGDGMMGDEQIQALVAFLQQGMVDKSDFINADKTVNGDAAHGEVLFKECAECHGDDGKTIDFDDGEEVEYVGTIAIDNPWEFFNKASVGNPGAIMPSGLNLGWSLQDIIDVLAYAQTLPAE